MKIFVKNAYSHNLKNISVSIPIGKITGITGVSGSGKSTLLKNVLGSYGVNNFTLVTSKTIRDSLGRCADIDVDKIDNLPHTILIDVKSSVSNPASTVSTVSGVHELLRNLFTEFGQVNCNMCDSLIKRNYSAVERLTADFKIDDFFKQALNYIDLNGDVIKIEYYDKNGNVTKTEKKMALSTVEFKLNKINERIIRDFNSNYNCRVRAFLKKSDETYDLLCEVECDTCHAIVPALSRSRLSFKTEYNHAGGRCRCCDGSGFVVELEVDRLFQDKTKGILLGASSLITEKGIKYTAVTEKFLEAAFDDLDININTPLKDILPEILEDILYGFGENITFTDRVGGKKTLRYQGVVNYLSESYKAGKGGVLLANLFNKKECSMCDSTRLDKKIECFSFNGKTIKSILKMTLNELGEWCREIKDDVSERAQKYLDRIINETDNFKLLSCDHLSLLRSSNTLSGGELQRIRICALLNSNVTGLCYLLDEPSSGLHYSDIEKLGVLFQKLCLQGNTLIMVEHNKKLLQYCDYIVDMGPFGGRHGGSILFSDELYNINKYNTATTQALLSVGENTKKLNLSPIESKDYLEFKNLSYNNLKDVTIKFPRNAFTVICGVSGSGKSTFIKQAVYSVVGKNTRQYGFDDIEYLGQSSRITSNLSTVASILKLAPYIAKIYEKESKYNKSCFMMGALEGKCPHCAGRRYIYSKEDEFIGVCDQCNGLGFNNSIISVKVDGINIYEIYNTSLEELGTIVKDKKIKKIIEAACALGVGYLTLSRSSKSLSKGEFQRVSLIQVLVGEEKNRLIILDEPSRGLHSVDSGKLIYALRQVTAKGNTLLVVEHNPDLIKNADYIVEFGGTGVSGGYVLFQGKAENIKDTPTASMLKGFKRKEICKKKDIKKNIIVSDGNKTVKYEPFQLYYAAEDRDMLLKASKKSRSDFLSVAIPNNIMFSKIDKNVIEAETPIIQTIDFGEKIKYSITIAESTNISQLLKRIVAYEDKSGIMKYVFDINSSTGKCATCGGTGIVYAVPTDFFIKENEISPSCKKFISNSTEYKKLFKCLKTEKIDISKSLNVMTSDERKAFFWGHDKTYEIGGKVDRWKGVENYFIEFYKYYPDKLAEDFFKNKKEITCPICEGRRLKEKYVDYNCNGFSYMEWMSLSISQLLNEIKVTNNITENEDLLSRLKLLSEIGLGHHTLSDELISLDSISTGKIKMASLYLNKIYGIGIVIENMDLLDKKDVKTIEAIAENWAKTNTIWII